MDVSLDKGLIRKRFEMAWDTYDGEATVQDRIAGNLMALATRFLDEPIYGKVLELGCGTGLLTRKFCTAFQVSDLFLNDLCLNLEPRLRSLLDRDFVYLPGDAERIDLPYGLDVVITASALQWLENAPGFISGLANNLKTGGYALVSTFVPGNLQEISVLTGKGLVYPSWNQWKEVVEDRYEVLAVKEETVVQVFGSVWDVLRHLKLTGVTGTGNFVWTRGSLKRFEDDYVNHFATSGGVSLTYRPLYMVLKRK